MTLSPVIIGERRTEVDKLILFSELRFNFLLSSNYLYQPILAEGLKTYLPYLPFLDLDFFSILICLSTKPICLCWKVEASSGML